MNLLAGRAAAHGDNAAMIASRRTFLEGGYYTSLRAAVAEASIHHLPDGGTILDAGCGECYYTAGVAARLAKAGMQASLFGFDVSKDAVLAGAKRKCAALFTASSYAIPAFDGSVDLLLSLFAPLAAEEFCRVLKPGGHFLMAVPAARHLFGLKEILYDTPYENPPCDESLAGFALLEKQDINDRIHITERAHMDSLFAMTPYYYRTPEAGRRRFAELAELSTEISFHLYIYRKEH